MCCWSFDTSGKASLSFVFTLLQIFFFCISSSSLYPSCVFCAEPERHGLVTPPLGRHIQTTKHVAECATGHGCPEPVHGDGGDEACGCSPYPAHKELHYSKRSGRCWHI